MTHPTVCFHSVKKIDDAIARLLDSETQECYPEVLSDIYYLYGQEICPDTFQRGMILLDVTEYEEQDGFTPMDFKYDIGGINGHLNIAYGNFLTNLGIIRPQNEYEEDVIAKISHYNYDDIYTQRWKDKTPDFQVIVNKNGTIHLTSVFWEGQRLIYYP